MYVSPLSNSTCLLHSRSVLVSSRNAPPHKRLLLCLWSNEQTKSCIRNLTNINEPPGAILKSIVAEFGRALCLQGTKRLICKNVCFKRLTKFQVKKKIIIINKLQKKGLIGLQDSYQNRLVLFNVHRYDEFYVPDLLIVLLHMGRLNSMVLMQTKAILVIHYR